MYLSDQLPTFPAAPCRDAIAECLAALAKASIADSTRPGATSSAVITAITTARRHFPDVMDHAEASERTTHLLAWIDELAAKSVFVDPIAAGYEFHVQSPARWGGFAPTLAVSLLIAREGGGVRITLEAPATLHDGDSISISIVEAGESALLADLDARVMHHGNFSSLRRSDGTDFILTAMKLIAW